MKPILRSFGLAALLLIGCQSNDETSTSSSSSGDESTISQWIKAYQNAENRIINIVAPRLEEVDRKLLNNTLKFGREQQDKILEGGIVAKAPQYIIDRTVDQLGSELYFSTVVEPIYKASEKGITRASWNTDVTEKTRALAHKCVNAIISGLSALTNCSHENLTANAAIDLGNIAGKSIEQIEEELFTILDDENGLALLNSGTPMVFGGFFLIAWGAKLYIGGDTSYKIAGGAWMGVGVVFLNTGLAAN